MKRLAIITAICSLVAGTVGTPHTAVRVGATAAPSPAWPLPGVSPATTVTQLDFGGNFQRSDLVQLEHAGGFVRSADPTVLGRLEQGELLTVKGVSPSAHVDFSSQAYFGRLEYEPFANSGLAPLSKPSANFVKNYCLPATGASRCAQVGRATGIIALLTPESIRSEARGFTRAKDRDFNRGYGGTVAIRPPGYVSRITQAGHLLGYELSGPVKNPRNFVSQLNASNAPAQSSLENAIKNKLTPTTSSTAPPASTDWVFVSVTPVYVGTCVVPYAIRYEAVGEDGWQLPTTAKGIAAQWLRSNMGTDGVTAAIIRNALHVGNRWLVPGQDPAATCVPAGYAG